MAIIRELRGFVPKIGKNCFIAENAVVVGDVDPDGIIADAKKIFSDFTAAKGVPARKANLGTLEVSDKKFSFGDGPLDIDTVYDSTPNAPRSYASIAVARQPKSRADSLERRIDFVQKHFPEETTTVWVGAIDPSLNQHSYIVPGLGDAGDLAYGDKE